MAVAVGSELDAWCTKCRLDLNHLVVAVAEAKPKRVECLTCHSQHNYRKPKGSASETPKAASGVKRQSKAASTSKSKAVTSTKRLNKAQSELLADWEARTRGKSAADFVEYSLGRALVRDQLVSHKKFGPGFVSELRENGKVTIVFSDGAKTLVHAR